jgi:acetoin utilization protein AcuB
VDSLLKAARVQDVMSTPAFTVSPDEPLEAAARVMRDEKIGSLPVVDHHQVVGIITETDLLRRLVVERVQY